MIKFKSFLLRQYIIPYLGEMRLVAAEIVFVSSPMSLALMGLTAYEVVIKSWASVHAPWLSLWIFLSFLVIPIIVMVIISWKFMLPSIYAASNAQSYAHNSPVARNIRKIMRKLEITEESTADTKD